MIERLALDTSAAVDQLREARQSPPQIELADKVFLPLPVVGELFHGAACSGQSSESHAINDAGFDQIPGLTVIHW